MKNKILIPLLMLLLIPCFVSARDYDFKHAAGWVLDPNARTITQQDANDVVYVETLDCTKARFNSESYTIDANSSLMLDPNTSLVYITCNDSGGCDVHMSEDSAVAGDIVSIVNVGTNNIVFQDAAGVSEIRAAAAIKGQYDVMKMTYIDANTWVQTGGSDN